jgi:hypothetical protein
LDVNRNNVEKIAYLILAHTESENLERLITSLISDFSNVYVHVDKKSKISDFKFLFNYKVSDSVYVLENRINVYWGGASIVHATNMLLETAYLNEENRYFQLLSGTDTLIKDKSFIKNKFINDELLNIPYWFIFQKRRWWGSDGYNRVAKVHFVDNSILNKKSLTNIKSVDSLLNIARSVFNNVFGYAVGIININSEMVYLKSSQWWCIDRHMARTIINFKSEKIKEHFKLIRVAAPDEVYYATILYNCGFELKSEDRYNSKYLHGNHLIKWTHECKSSPLAISIHNDRELIDSTSAIFARKVVE